MPGTNQSPLAVTDDAFKASRLERMLSNFTASYKIYFLKAVFDAAISGEPCVAYDRLAASMVASAWYPVLFFRLNLGATDQLARVVDTAHARLALDQSASRGDVVAAILSTNDQTVARQLRDLCRYVPYRLLRIFYENRFAEEKAATGPIRDGRVNRLISKFNREDPAGAPYVLEYDRSDIVVDPG